MVPQENVRLSLTSALRRRAGWGSVLLRGRGFVQRKQIT